ncbi:N-6 DNA methylase [Mucilaginibacter lappiensis]|uniref:Type I restriction enzyme M protein n=1 Tax=Mucilaginibacter lappiensis TaxID=354630 RepID=A0A841JUI8_9SPHI|nr:N-6 DNA methylase [Mucilaginibacter lappiensis]MBB6131491.1 type I restriction enzyme M protein [Mucilaginibacter lappiensis]
MYYDLKKLKKIFDQISYARTEMNAFTDIIDFSLLAFRFYKTADELQSAHQKLTTHPQCELIGQFMTELADLNPYGFADPLGEFYMMHISYGRLGQYFTPEPITEMMALMTMPEITEPGQKVLDPACGSGRFLLSAAKQNRLLKFYGADLDPICCKMALLNMLLNSLTGEIANINSISNEFFTGYHVKTKLIGGYHYPYFEEFTDPMLSYIWLHPEAVSHNPKSEKKPPVPVFIQGDLFS